MTARNSVNRILVATDNTSVEDEFDQCVIETELGDVFALLCFPVSGKPNYYSVTIYKTMVFVGQVTIKEEEEEYIARVINASKPVYSQTFFASTPMFKRGMLSDMLECIQKDDADTWENLKKEFGCENASAVYDSHGQVAVC